MYIILNPVCRARKATPKPLPLSAEERFDIALASIDIALAFTATPDDDLLNDSAFDAIRRDLSVAHATIKPDNE